MKKYLLKLTFPVLFLLICCGSTAAVSDLGRAIPDDVFLYIHGKHNPERDFLKPKYDALKQAFKDSGVIDEVINLILGHIEGKDKEAAALVINKVKEAIYGVPWSDLIEKESVYAQKMQIPSPPHLFIARVEEKKIPLILTGIRHLMDEVKALSEIMVIKEEDFLGAHITSLNFAGIPQALGMANIDDTVWLSTSVDFMKSALGRYKENEITGSILSNAVLVRSTKKLHEWEDEIVFFNFKKMLEGYKGLLQFVSMAAAEDKDAGPKLMMVSDLIDQIGIYDCITTVSYMEKNKCHKETLLLFSDEGKTKPLHGIFFSPGRKTGDYRKFIPENATAFSASPGIPLSDLYQFIKGYIIDKLPEGEGIFAMMKQKEEQIGLSLEEDVLSWMDGSYISISIPAKNPSPFGGGDWVFLLATKNKEKASAVVEKLMNRLTTTLEASKQGFKLQITPLEEFKEQNLKSITVSSFPFIQPVYGFLNGYFLLGSSTGAVESVMKVVKGEAKNIEDNPKLKLCGKLPSSGIRSVSFSDKENSAAEMAGILGGLSFAGAFIPDEGKETAIVKSIFTVLAKLVPVVQKWDFTLAEMSYCRLEPEGLFTNTVTVYKTE